MMKVIFLDIDGVLNSETDFIEVAMYGHEHNEVEHELKGGRKAIAPINRGKLALLEMIIKATDAKIVISSTWREHMSLGEIHDKFAAQGFRLPRTCIVGKTENSRTRFSQSHTDTRCAEILAWLENKKDVIESFVILDDISPRLFYDVDDNLVTTSEYDGLNKLQATQAINILGRNEEAQKEHDKYMEDLELLMRCMV